MYLVVKGKLDLSNYFAIMLLSSTLLVLVVLASAFLPHDKLYTALLMCLLSIISLGSSAKVMSLLLKQPSE